MLIVSPYHLDEPLAAFDYSGPRDATISVPLPDVADRWRRMESIYQRVADTVAASKDMPVVVAGDCTTSLGIIAGLQRSHGGLGIVWFDAHGDFHTEQTTTSGYLGGLPLAMAVGVGTSRLPALGLQPVDAERTLLVGARDLDPPEAVLLADHEVPQVGTDELSPDDLPAGPLYLHIDIDVCDPTEIRDLLFPAPGGPSLPTLHAAAQVVLATRRVAAIGMAATWHHGGPAAAENDAALQRMLAHFRATWTATRSA